MLHRLLLKHVKQGEAQALQVLLEVSKYYTPVHVGTDVLHVYDRIS